MNKKEPLQTGAKAPDFSLKNTPDQEVTLTDFLGNPVVLVFYPADFSPICSDEVSLFNEFLPDFKKFNTQVLGISVDNVWSHLAFARERDIHFPLLADFNPKGGAAKKYNAYREEEGYIDRALYVIDDKGDIAWGYVSPIGVNPGVDRVFKVLEKL